MKQGKCTVCKIYWTWDKELHSRYCKCPICNEQLQSTTHLLKWEKRKAYTANVQSNNMAFQMLFEA